MTGDQSSPATLAQKSSGLVMLVPDVDMSQHPLLRGLSRTLRANTIERMMFILGVLLLHGAPFAGEDDFCPLHFKKLGRLVGPRGLRKIREQMIRAGLIETDGHYVPEKKSFGFRLSSWTLQQPLIEIPVSIPQARRINCYAPEAVVIRPPEDPTHLILWRNLHQLIVDPAAWAELEDGRRLRSAALSQRICSLRMIEWHAWAFSVSPTTGRVFNNFTSIAADLRAYLGFRGCCSAYAEVDVSASQLYILALLYPSGSTEKPHYLDVVTSGEFYEELQGDCARRFKSRKALKVGVMVEILFGRQEHGGELWSTFQRRFPELAGLMDAYHDGSGSALAIFLQRTEAAAMIGRVVPRLHEAAEGRPFLTLHDGIFCGIEDAHLAARVIQEEFGQLVGVPPSVTIKVHPKPGSRSEAA